MWLPAMPVKASLIWQAAISSASSSARRIDCTVASMLTTTPLRSPCEAACPSPMTWKRPSGSASATATTTLEVPISSPTIRSLVSVLMDQRVLGSLGRARRGSGETVGIAGVDARRRSADARDDHRVGGNDVGQALLQRRRRCLRDRVRASSTSPAPLACTAQERRSDTPMPSTLSDSAASCAREVVIADSQRHAPKHPVRKTPGEARRSPLLPHWPRRDHRGPTAAVRHSKHRARDARAASPAGGSARCAAPRPAQPTARFRAAAARRPAGS